MKGPYRVNRQPRHLLAKLGLRGVKRGNEAQHARAHRKTFAHSKGGFGAR